MKRLLLSLGVVSATLLAQTAQAKTPELQWKVTAAETVFDLKWWPFNLVDEQGVYGEVGREFQVQNAKAVLDPAYEATLYRYHDLYDYGWNVKDYELNARFLFSYDIVDADTRAVIATENHALLYKLGGNTSLGTGEVPDGYSFRAGQSFTALDDLGVFSGIEKRGFGHGTSYSFAAFTDAPSGSTTLVYPFSESGNTGYWGMDVKPEFFNAPLALVPSVKTTIHLAAPVPEPETYAMLAAGLIGLGIARRRRAGAA